MGLTFDRSIGDLFKEKNERMQPFRAQARLSLMGQKKSDRKPFFLTRKLKISDEHRCDVIHGTGKQKHVPEILIILTLLMYVWAFCDPILFVLGALPYMFEWYGAAGQLYSCG